MKKKLILLTLVMSLTIVSQSTFSLGMGNIQVYSSLDEPLRANIELIVSPDEDLQNLTVTLASSADYQRVGLDRSFVPGNISVALDENNPTIVNVTSNGPVSEPIVSLLLDVNWNNGRILREFTVLLDPPAYEVSSADVQVNNVVVDQVGEAVVEDTNDEQPQLQERTAPAEQTVTTYTNEDVQADSAATELSRDSYDSEVFVNAGDTLWGIANRNKLGGLSTNQMMIAIFNNNSSAFIDNNINKLIKGSRLTMPTMAEAEAISYSEALAEVESHNQNWSGSAATDYSSFQTTTDDDLTDEYDSASLDYGVQLSGGDSDGSDNGQTNADAGDDDSTSLTAEEAFNQESQQADMQDRISELEDIVEQQQSVIEIQDGGLSNLENQLAEANEGDSVAMTDDGMEEGVAVDDNLVDDVWDTPVDDATTDGGLDLQLTDVDTTATDDDMSGISGTGSDTESEELDGAVQPAEESADKSPPKFTAVPAQTESMVDKTINWVMDNLQWVLIGLVGLILVIFVPRFLSNRGAGDEEETSFLDDIKQRNKEADELDDPTEMADTKLNAPLPDDADSATEDEAEEVDSDEDGDVLAELDKSIMFGDQEEQDDDISQLLDEAEQSDPVSTDDGGFDLDGFLDDDNDDEAEGDVEDDLTESGVEPEAEESLVADDLSDDDFNFDLDDLEDDGDSTKTLERDLSESQKAALGSEDSDETMDESDDDFDLNLEDEFAELDLDDDDSDDAETAVEVDDASESDADEIDFDEDFDFDLDDELDDMVADDAADEETPVEVAVDEAADDEEFDDILDLSDDDSDDFNIDEGDDTMDDELDLGLEGLLDEGDAIDTKLDLAKAYLDMGDNEGAKNLLEEVASEGNDSQVEAARKLLDDM